MVVAKATSDEVRDFLAAGRYDISTFQEKVLCIAVNPAQRRLYRFINPGEDGWQWRLKIVIHVAANQIGKSLGLAVVIIWASTYKMGIDSSDYGQWLSSAYLWVHGAPKQSQAYIPLRDIRHILKGTHAAQEIGRKRFGLTFRLPSGWAVDIKIETYYEGLEFWNGAVVQFRTTQDKAEALQGIRAHGISLDEAGFEDHLKAVVYETLLMRLISTGGIFLMVGTPNGLTEYYEFVRDVIDTGEDVGDRSWLAADSALVWSHISDNVGYGIDQSEVDRMESNLDAGTKEQQLRGAFLEPAEAFFVPSNKVLDAFKKNLPESQLPKPGHSYVIMWDPSVASDPTAVIVLDVTNPNEWIGVYFKHYQKPPSFTVLVSDISQLHSLYNTAAHTGRKSRAITAYDSTSMGGAIVRQSLTHVTPNRPVNFAGAAMKVTALASLRAALIQGRLKVPSSWLKFQRELLNYRLKDDKIQQDTVMAAAGAVAVASKGFGGSPKASFRVQRQHSVR